MLPLNSIQFTDCITVSSPSALVFSRLNLWCVPDSREAEKEKMDRQQNDWNL